MSAFLQALRSDRVLLMDGAMGTELQRAGIEPGTCYEAWNLTHPERVQAIHRSYVEAGAEVLLTNTFQANLEALARHGLDKELETLVCQGIHLARTASPGAFVVADLGPLGIRQRLDTLRRLLPALRAADAILLETCSDFEDLASLLDMRPCDEATPLLVSFTFLRAEDGSLLTSTRMSPEACARRASQTYPIAALGANCGREIGMKQAIEIVRRYRDVTDLPLFARPNAGTPIRTEGQWLYPHTPEAMAARLPALLEAGVCMLGGCCGTTPEHIAAFRSVVDTEPFPSRKRKRRLE